MPVALQQHEPLARGQRGAATARDVHALGLQGVLCGQGDGALGEGNHPPERLVRLAPQKVSWQQQVKPAGGGRH